MGNECDCCHINETINKFLNFSLYIFLKITHQFEKSSKISSSCRIIDTLKPLIMFYN